MDNAMVVTREEWLVARKELLAREKAATKAKDELSAERRRLPMVEIDKEYAFEGPGGRAGLRDLFEGRRQLIVYHFMYGPGAPGWPTAGCPGCSMVADQIIPLAHLQARDTSFAMISRGPLRSLLAYKQRMGWDLPWYSSESSDFNDDFEVTTPKGETFGLSVFLRDGSNIYRTYFTAGRGVETLGPVFTLLDLTPYGRQEEWEDSPEGWPRTPPYQWWQRHDEYDAPATG